jgi:hypothetical protein
MTPRILSSDMPRFQARVLLSTSRAADKLRPEPPSDQNDSHQLLPLERYVIVKITTLVLFCSLENIQHPLRYSDQLVECNHFYPV